MKPGGEFVERGNHDQSQTSVDEQNVSRKRGGKSGKRPGTLDIDEATAAQMKERTAGGL